MNDRQRDSIDEIELPQLRGVRVLIVDDEADGRDLVARILEGRGAEPRGASSAEEALDMLTREQFDVLLSDIGMPGTDGFELIRRVRLLDTGRRLAAIAITAYARTEDRQRSLLAGFHMHLSKPIEAPELIASIAGLLHLSR